MCDGQKPPRTFDWSELRDLPIAKFSLDLPIAVVGNNIRQC